MLTWGSRRSRVPIAFRCWRESSPDLRARQWFEQVASGQAQSFAEIARAEGVGRRYVANLIPLAFLAPDIVANILSGTQPFELTTQELTKRVDLPLDWAEQRALLGFD